jgi:predicted MPP superfamily phosphohydrolase
MKIQILADMHLEFLMNPAVTPSRRAQALLAAIHDTQADVTVFCGDTYTKGRSCKKARDLIPPERPVILVAGNHEHYGDTYQHSMDRLRKDAAESPGVHFLENEAVEIDGVVFLGCTLWSDMRLFQAGADAGLYSFAQTIEECKQAMNDYRQIRYLSGAGPYRLLHPNDTLRMHAASTAWLAEQFKRYRNRTMVVVTHHAPSSRSVHESYRQDILSAAYASHLDPLVEQSGAALWLHGHNHEVMDYRIGRTRVLANCYGYEYEVALAKGFRPDWVVEV